MSTEEIILGFVLGIVVTVWVEYWILRRMFATTDDIIDALLGRKRD